MLLLAITSAVFGWLAARMFSAAPFVAGNVIAAAGIVVFGVVNGWMLAHLLAALSVAIVSMQAGFVFASLREAGRGQQSSSLPATAADKGLAKESSAIDRPL